MAASRWVFPPPTTSPTFFNTSILNTNLAVFLNESTSAWPSTGFGRTPTFDDDVVRLEWPSSSTNPSNVNWHCLPCRQLSSSNNETANWEACTYPTTDTLPELLTVSVPVRSSQGDDYYNWALNTDTSLPRETRTSALMCTFGIPAAEGPYHITQPFRFTNSDRDRVTDQRSFVFNATTPEGVESSFRDGWPYHDRWRWSTSAVAGVAFAMIALFIAILAGVAYLISRKKKQKRALAAMLAAREDGGNLGAAPQTGVADVEKGEKSEMRAEREEGEGLPRYEGPPGYTEAASETASSSASVRVTEPAAAVTRPRE